jgi:hypothetical protein
MTFCAGMKAMEGHLTEHNIVATCNKVWRWTRETLAAASNGIPRGRYGRRNAGEETPFGNHEPWISNLLSLHDSQSYLPLPKYHLIHLGYHISSIGLIQGGVSFRHLEGFVSQYFLTALWVPRDKQGGLRAIQHAVARGTGQRIDARDCASPAGCLSRVCRAV